MRLSPSCFAEFTDMSWRIRRTGTVLAQYAGTRREFLKAEMRFAVGRLAGYLTLACYLTIIHQELLKYLPYTCWRESSILRVTELSN